MDKIVTEEIRGNEFLRPGPGGDVVIGATTGQEPIWDETDLFAYVDPDFKNWGAYEKGSATSETSVRVREMVKDGTYSQFFGSLSADVNKLCLTPAQIADFIRDHHDLLRADGCATFFLFKSHDHLFVAGVRVSSDGLGVEVEHFEDSFVWNAECRPRVVVPQLA